MYPTSIDTLEDLLVARNTFRTQLITPVGPSDTSLVVGNVTGLQASNGLVSIGDEVISYTSISTGGANPVLQGCTRGFDNTTAVAHTAGELVELRWVALHHNRLTLAINAMQAAIGVDPADDTLNGGAFASIVERLASTLPLLVSKASATDWTLTHGRRRVVGVQCWRLVSGSTYAIITPTVLSQAVNPVGDSTVTIQFPVAYSGYVVLT